MIRCVIAELITHAIVGSAEQIRYAVSVFAVVRIRKSPCLRILFIVDGKGCERDCQIDKCGAILKHPFMHNSDCGRQNKRLKRSHAVECADFYALNTLFDTYFRDGCTHVVECVFRNRYDFLSALGCLYRYRRRTAVICGYNAVFNSEIRERNDYILRPTRSQNQISVRTFDNSFYLALVYEPTVESIAVFRRLV